MDNTIDQPERKNLIAELKDDDSSKASKDQSDNENSIDDQASNQSEHKNPIAELKYDDSSKASKNQSDNENPIDDQASNQVMPINQEQEKVIEKLEELLKFMKITQIKNEECFVNIKKPLDELFSCLKYLPSENAFDNLPTEITTKILSYTCNNGAFMAASVCQNWKDILKGRLNTLERVDIGNHCSNSYQCENNTCFKPVEMLKASITHQLDVPLKICHSIRHVDSELITDALTSVSNFIINNHCDCYRDYQPVMTDQQLARLFEEIKNNRKVMESVEITELDLSHLNHETVVDCFIDKAKKVTVNEDNCGVNFEVLIRKILHDSTDMKLTHLTVSDLWCSSELSTDLADALCKIEHVKFKEGWLRDATAKRLVHNILTRPIKMKSLYIGQLATRSIFSTLNTQDLRNVYDKMEALSLSAKFSLEQVEAARSVPGVEIHAEVWGNEYIRIAKGFRTV